MVILSLAPFQGITDSVYRNLFKKHFYGIDKYYTPFFSGIHKDNSRSLKVEEIDPKKNDVGILTPQILSNDADEIIRFANQCQDMGYREINFNMGCPFPRVANKVRGCGLMTEPKKALEIFEKVFDNITIKFSIKCRLGYYQAIEIEDFIDTFNTYPFSEVIIHPRIGKQLYGGMTDSDKFEKLIPLINKSLVYNGDIFTKDDYQRLSNRFSSVSTFMLGRGLLANPFLAGEIKGKVIEIKERKKILHHFVVSLYLERLYRMGESSQIIGRMKELWSYLINSFEEPQVIWCKIKKINDLKIYEETIESIFRNEKLKGEK